MADGNNSGGSGLRVGVRPVIEIEDAGSTRAPTARFAAFGELSAAESAFLTALIESGRSLAVARGADIRSGFGSSCGVYFLENGWVSAGTTLRNGRTQIFKIHLPGDILGAPSLAFKEPVEALTALGPSRIILIPTEKIRGMFRDRPDLSYRIFLGAQQERVFLMERLAIGGQLSAKHAMAAFLVDLHRRMARAGMADCTCISTPLTQDQIGQVLGISEVHVNRVLADLVKCGLIKKIRNGYDLLDVDKLQRFSQLHEHTLVDVEVAC